MYTGRASRPEECKNICLTNKKTQQLNMGHWLMRELHAERPHADEGMGLVNKEERSSFSLRVTSPVDGKCQKEDSARANLPKWLHGWRLMGQWCGLAQVHTPSQSWLMNHNSASERLGIITSWVRVCLAETRRILLHNWLARSSSDSWLWPGLPLPPSHSSRVH